MMLMTDEGQLINLDHVALVWVEQRSDKSYVVTAALANTPEWPRGIVVRKRPTSLSAKAALREVLMAANK